MDVFALNDYRAVLKTSLLDRKEQFPKEFTFQKMAEACRVQKTYLSTVLSGTGHLNTDQIYLACEFLGFTPLQSEYTSFLHEYERSVVPKRKKELLAQIASCRKRADKSEAHLDSEVVDLSGSFGDLAEYYLNPLFVLAHLYLTIDKYASNVELLAAKLSIPPAALSRVLTSLSKLGIVEVKDGRYHVVKSNLHLPPESFVFPIHRKLMRTKTVEQLERLDRDGDSPYSFSVTFSANEAVRAKLHERFLKFIKSAQQLVADAPQEEVYQLNFDLFHW